jgi:hypothetical protein
VNSSFYMQNTLSGSVTPLDYNNHCGTGCCSRGFVETLAGSSVTNATYHMAMTMHASAMVVWLLPGPVELVTCYLRGVIMRVGSYGVRTGMGKDQAD